MARPKKAAAAAEEVKAEAKDTEIKMEETKKKAGKAEEVREEKPAKKAPTKRTTAKKAAEAVSTVFVQYLGKEFSDKELIEAAKASYTALGNKAEEIKTLEIYVKPEENAAYYVVNGDGADEFKIEL